MGLDHIPYCLRCDRAFQTERSLYQHIWSSRAHLLCSVCNFDGSSFQELIDHHRATGHGGRTYVPDDDLNVCPQCERHFDDPNQLYHHEMIHYESNIECIGCDRMFTTFPGMIIHLESGTCESKINVTDLNESAAICYSWRRYLRQEYRDNLRECQSLHRKYGDKRYPFKCPTCNHAFAKLSGLFQHVASPACVQGLDQGAIGKLIRWLWSRHAAGAEDYDSGPPRNSLYPDSFKVCSNFSIRGAANVQNAVQA